MAITRRVLVGLTASMLGGVAYAQQPVKLDIEAQPLDRALNSWANQTGYQVLIPVERAAQGRTAPALKGRYTPEGALKILLASSELRYEFVNERTVTIRNAAARQDAAPKREADGPAESSSPLVIAQSRPRETQAAAANATSDASQQRTQVTRSREGLEEVIVSAQKRSERLQDVPIPVSAVSADSLVDSNQLRIQDYYTKIPGLNVVPGIAGQQFLVIRGIASGSSSSANPVVSVTVDDTPYGSSTGLGGGGFGVPDFDPSDLARIEVLRGPQGTLYGASSMGGLIKFVTVDPSPDALSGQLSAGLNDTSNGGSLGYYTRGSLNVPLGETVAVRASGFYRRNPGYIDNVVTGQQDVNRIDTKGGRLSGMWRPSESFSVKLSALIQNNETGGYPYAAPALGDLRQNFIEAGLSTTNKRDAYSATLEGKAGNVEITSVTGYSEDRSVGAMDVAFLLTPAINQAQFGLSGTGSSSVANLSNDKFTQELRFAAPLGTRIDGLLGLFYTHEKSRYVTSFYAVDPTTGAALAKWIDFDTPSTFREYAVFADLTFHVTDRFDVQLGGRQSNDRLISKTINTGPYVPRFLGTPSPAITPEATTKSDAFTYLVTPRFKIHPDLMLYARFASGYRPGGPNANPGTFNGTSIARQYDPDKTINYEAGIKGDFLDRAISIDASVYYIDWKDLQLQLREPVSRIVYYANAARAKSQGVELSIEGRLPTGLTLAAWTAWNDAVLKTAFPSAGTLFGASGDRLPYSSRFSATASAEQEFMIGGNVSLSLGASVSYVGDRMGIFRGPNLARQTLPAYTKTDIHAGMKYAAWSANVFLNNATNRRGVLDGGLGYVYPDKFSYVQPRTVGLSVARTF